MSLPRSAAADVNLLFGILAVQLEFITRDQLVAAMNTWVLDKERSLGDILVEQRVLVPERQALMQALVHEHLKQHGADPQRSLSAFPTVESIKRDLERIADADVLASITGWHERGDSTATASAKPTTNGMRFRILRPHARGGLGKVSVAQDEELHREVALKEIQDRHASDPESRARFVLEAEITGGLEHPGIVPVYGLGQYADGRPYYAMRFIRGDSLKDAINGFHQGNAATTVNGERTLRFRKLLGRFIDVCQAMQYAHDRGVLHRDLKPGNIMLGKYGETLVVDWGLAKLTSMPARVDSAGRSEAPKDEAPLRPTSGSGVAATVAGSAVGTPAFMSPEQAAGRLDLLGPTTDVYSLGATLFCLLTGKPPVEDRDPGALLKKVQTGQFPRPRQVKPDVDLTLEAICLKAMALNPADRFSSPHELASDIEHWLADEPVTAYREPLPVRAGRWARKHKPLVSGVAAALVVGAMALTAGGFWYHDQQTEVAAKHAIAQEKVRQALEQAEKTRGELHATLKKPGGVFELLNQPVRWKVQIASARGDWRRAEEHATATFDRHWTNQITLLDKNLTSDEADYDLALRLERVRLERATRVEGKFGLSRPPKQYAAEFANAGLTPERGRESEVAARMQQSAIKEQLIATADDWAYWEHAANNPEMSSLILAVVRLADPDPWRNRVRDLELWRSPQAISKLAQESQLNKEFIARLSPQLLDLVFYLLPTVQEKENWLRTAHRFHPTDFWINFHLGIVAARSGENREAAGFFRVALLIRPDSAPVYYNLAVALNANGDLPGTIDAYQKALAIDPGYALARNNLSVVLHLHGDASAAIDGFNKILAIDATNAKAWYGLGVVLGEQNDRKGAIDAYRKAVANDPQYAEAWNNLGIILRQQKDLPGSIDACRKAIAANPELVNAWSNLGSALRENEDLPGAIDAIRKGLAIDSKHAGAWYSLGIALRENKDLPGAIDAYKKAVAIDPKHVAAWSNLGMTLRESNEPAAAIKALNKALAIDPKHSNTWYNLGISLQEREDFPAAIVAYKKALAIDPNRTDAWTNLGITLMMNNELPEAIVAFDKALAINPKHSVAWYNLGHALAEKMELAAAFDAYNQALAINPKYAKAWFSLGNARMDNEELDAALDAYRRGLALDPKNSPAWFSLAKALTQKKDTTAAIDAYQRVVAIDPNYAAAWYNLGNALQAKKDLPAAIDAYNKAAAIEPNKASTWYNLGNAHYEKKELAASIDAYQRALKVNPKHAGAWNNLGRSYRAQKDIPAAIDAFKKTLALDPKNAAAAKNLDMALRDHKNLPPAPDAKNAAAWHEFGNALYAKKDLPAAIDAYNKSLALDPKNAQGWFNLGIVLHGQKDLPAAIDAYQKALAINPKLASVWTNLGNALYVQRDLTAASDAHKKALAIDPKEKRAWLGLGNVLKEQKDLPAASDAYKKALALDPNYALGWANLGNTLRSQKDLPAAIDAYNKALAIDPKSTLVRTSLAAAERLLALEKRLPGVLRGDDASVADLLSLADFSRRHKELHRDAVTLYARAFAAELRTPDQLAAGHRYDAACSAALAAAGKDVDAEEQAKLRKQAIDWLHTVLEARVKLLATSRLSAIPFVADMQNWRLDPDLASLRDDKELLKLPDDERAAARKLWADVDRHAKDARGRFTETIHKGQLAGKERDQRHAIKMSGGKTYVITMDSQKFNTLLRLEDDKGKIVAENDDVSKTNLNSRIVFTATLEGTFRVVASSFEQRGSGEYTVTVREFAPAKK